MFVYLEGIILLIVKHHWHLLQHDWTELQACNNLYVNMGYCSVQKSTIGGGLLGGLLNKSIGLIYMGGEL